MPDITEHHSKEEGESHNSKNRWVHFTKHGHTIGVNNLLESLCKLISLYISWWLNGVVLKSLEVSCGITSKLFPDVFLLIGWAPEVANIGIHSLPHEVHGGIYSLFFSDEPLVYL
jgi:hypothetical protein